MWERERERESVRFSRLDRNAISRAATGSYKTDLSEGNRIGTGRDRRGSARLCVYLSSLFALAGLSRSRVLAGLRFGGVRAALCVLTPSVSLCRCVCNTLFDAVVEPGETASHGATTPLRSSGRAVCVSLDKSSSVTAAATTTVWRDRR